ncbi:type II secretion system protein [Naasia sp. SYSU D00057]|uniref:type II secretion system protein n=1 Tax=Naasia sp. SYSU D00057 TaxID=2817380 RepID=UPI001B308AA2|nr:prepilin-type N-terminal cleavage/methylation domain-containing protein [Naasia sp. SYSU D00057]
MIKNITAALAAKRAELGKDEKGFTLIELLVVVLIIGILAAIAIPVFLTQQDQAKDSAVESDLGNAKVAYVSYLVANPSGTATGNAATVLDEYGFNASDDNTITIATGGSNFCISGARTGSSDAWSITADEGVRDVGCGTTGGTTTTE